MSVLGPRLLADLEAELKAAVPSGGPAALLYDMARYHMGWTDAEGRPAHAPSGKRVRPSLCLLACTGYGADYSQAMPAAAALELLHNFTLIHDDIQDRSDERRHRPTVWRIWGEAQAINAGDAMNSLARLALLRMSERGVPAERVAEALALLERTCVRVCEGQCLDLAFEGRLDITYDDYMGMIGRKTAALIGCSLEMGALVAGAPPDERQGTRALGETLGLAYQVQDDILGIWGDPSATGKPTADDIRCRKKSLPVVHVLEHGSRAQRSTIASLYSRMIATEADVAVVLKVLEDAGARQFAEREAGRLFDNTVRRLAALSIDEHTRQALRSLIDSLLHRSF